MSSISKTEVCLSKCLWLGKEVFQLWNGMWNGIVCLWVRNQSEWARVNKISIWMCDNLFSFSFWIEYCRYELNGHCLWFVVQNGWHFSLNCLLWSLDILKINHNQGTPFRNLRSCIPNAINHSDSYWMSVGSFRRHYHEKLPSAPKMYTFPWIWIHIHKLS